MLVLRLHRIHIHLRASIFVLMYLSTIAPNDIEMGVALDFMSWTRVKTKALSLQMPHEAPDS